MSAMVVGGVVIASLPACKDDGDDGIGESGTTELGSSGPSSSEESGSTLATDEASSTGEDLPEGYCDGGDHGPYRCECTSGESEACEGDGFRVCYAIDQEVLTEEAWSPCGECVPGDSQDCTTELDEPGRRFCNQADAYISYVETLPTPIWGACLLADQIVCEPGEPVVCPDDSEGACDVDEQGVPVVESCD